ncbi:MAG: bacillithiol biosynthesis cysteine-adding enzyme BshC [Flammeovirgaceae bacterium]
MNLTQIPLEATHQFSPLFLDYIHNEPHIKPFFHRFPSMANFEAQIKEKQFAQNQREMLVEAIHEQYSTLTNKPNELIQSLLEPNTFTVTTGHQLNIFTGSLFFIYKIITTIKLAKELSQHYPQYRFVPVYWMASEDHDFAEINHFYLFNKKFTWYLPEAKGAVGKLNPSTIVSICDEIKEIPAFFRDAYQNSSNLAEATRKIVHHLFGKEGLLVVDGDNNLLKKSIIPIIKDDLLNHSAKQLVEKSDAILSSSGYDTQIYVRDINFFYLDSFVRERIEKEGNEYQVLNTSLRFSKEDIMDLIEVKPEKFSPNVALRPIYQEMILPNLAYIGGPAEVTYWLQLKSVFDHYKVLFPMVVPRNFAMILSQANVNKLAKLNVQARDLFLPEKALKEIFLEKNSQKAVSLDSAYQKLEELTLYIALIASAVDKSLDGFVKSEMKQATKIIETIEKRIKKAEDFRHEVAFKQLFALKDKLFPNGIPQERHDNYLQFALNDEQFIEKLMNNFSPLVFQYNILEY